MREVSGRAVLAVCVALVDLRLEDPCLGGWQSGRSAVGSAGKQKHKTIYDHGNLKFWSWTLLPPSRHDLLHRAPAPVVVQSLLPCKAGPLQFPELIIFY